MLFGTLLQKQDCPSEALYHGSRCTSEIWRKKPDSVRVTLKDITENVQAPKRKTKKKDGTNILEGAHNILLFTKKTSSLVEKN